VKILILSPRLPHALGKADSMTVYRLIKYFARRHEVYLVCFYTDSSELTYVPDLERLCKDVRCIRLRKWKAALKTIGALIAGRLPLQVAYYLNGQMRRTVDKVLQQYEPDLAYAHLIRMGEYLKEKKGVGRVLAMQISQTLNYRRMIANIRSLRYRVVYGIEYRRVRKYEPAITKYFDTCLLISKYDKESLDGHEQINNVFYSPHGVDVEFYKAPLHADKEDAILFCGVLETPTNVDAVLYFYRDIYPLVKREVPNVKLYLAGKNPPPTIRRLANEDPSVVVTGFVEDIRPYYEKARVGVAPLRIGAGLQNKLLIGMSMGQPMVCTSIANEGIAAKPDSEVLVADTPETFAAAVVELLTNGEKAATLARNARKHVEEKWTWEHYLEQLEEHFAALANSSVKRRPS